MINHLFSPYPYALNADANDLRLYLTNIVESLLEVGDDAKVFTKPALLGMRDELVGVSKDGRMLGFEVADLLGRLMGTPVLLFQNNNGGGYHDFSTLAFNWAEDVDLCRVPCILYSGSHFQVCMVFWF